MLGDLEQIETKFPLVINQPSKEHFIYETKSEGLERE